MKQAGVRLQEQHHYKAARLVTTTSHLTASRAEWEQQSHQCIRSGAASSESAEMDTMLATGYV